jgi:hypothetical protein
MKNLNLNFVSRFNLTAILSQVEGNLGKLSALQSIFEKIRFTEDEAKQVLVTPQENGTATYSIPENQPDFGKLDISIEDSQAGFLLAEIENWQRFKMSDLGWVEKLKSELKEPVKRKKQLRVEEISA